jgi:single-strand DNA-binding protein
MVNKVTLIGHTGRDPEVKHLESGAVVASISVATGEKYKDKNGDLQSTTEWHNVVIWRELAEVVEKYCKKGMLVYVEGKVSYRKFLDKDKNERTATDIVASAFRILERKEGSGGGNLEAVKFPTEESGRQVSNSNAASSLETAVTQGGDDLPF